MTNKCALLLAGFLYLNFFTGCTLSQKRSSSGIKEDSMTVDIKDQPERSLPKITQKTVENSFGPLPKETVHNSINSNSRKASGPSALLVSAGLYRAVSAISLFRELGVVNRVPPVLMGHGLSAVVVSYFAFGFEADFVEWKFFQFIKKAKNLKPFSEDWIELFERVLLKEIESKNIEEANFTLIIPAWDKDQHKTVYLKRGALKSALLANIDYYNLQSSRLEPAMGRSFISKSFLKSLKIKKVFILDLLSSGISWKTGDGLLNGIFQRAASIILEEKEVFDVIMTYPVSEYELDDPEKLADLIFLSKKLAKKYLSEFTKEEEL